MSLDSTHSSQPTPTARIALLATGGTIASTVGGDGRLVPRLRAADLAARLPATFGLEVEAHDAALVAGWNMTPPLMLELARRASELLAGGAAGIVVTHGTDTIEETATLLGLAVTADRPVVVTGAMRHDGAAGADGPANLRDAALVAAEPAAAGRGCLVVLAGQVHAAPWVTKAHSHALDAFASPGRGPVGSVRAGRVAFTAQPERRAPLAVAHADAEVALVRVAAGCRPCGRRWAPASRWCARRGPRPAAPASSTTGQAATPTCAPRGCSTAASAPASRPGSS